VNRQPDAIQRAARINASTSPNVTRARLYAESIIATVREPRLSFVAQ
jgi:hypothetical protein